MIKEYEIAILYTVEHLTDCKIFASSEDEAIAIAKAIFEKKHKEPCKFQSAKVRKL